jgi:hypothetical protein
MKEPEPLSYFFADHANGRFAASYRPAPGLKNSHHTAPSFITPQANNALPLPGAAEHNPPKANTTVGSLVADNHLKQFGREGLGTECELVKWMLTINGQCYLTTLLKGEKLLMNDKMC